MPDENNILNNCSELIPDGSGNFNVLHDPNVINMQSNLNQQIAMLSQISSILLDNSRDIAILKRANHELKEKLSDAQKENKRLLDEKVLSELSEGKDCKDCLESIPNSFLHNVIDNYMTKALERIAVVSGRPVAGHLVAELNKLTDELYPVE